MNNSDSNQGQKDFTTSQINKSGTGGGGQILGGPRENQLAMMRIETHQPVVIYEDMKAEMKEFAFEIADQVVRMLYKGDKKFFKDAAEYIKKEFDARFKSSWHVIVGRNFGSFVTYEQKSMILFWINQFGFLIFKHG